MKFQKGKSGNPNGRPPSGRTQCLETLDAMLAQEGNQKKLREALQRAFDDNPGAFFSGVVAPLVPKESLVKVATEEKAPVRIVIETEPEVK